MDFLQSDHWRKFQESFGRKTFSLKKDEISAGIVEHRLPLVGKYFYIPRGLLINCQSLVIKSDFINELLELAEKNRTGWIRLDINNKKEFELLKNNINLKIRKAAHDMQPREVFIIDIAKKENELLSEMKSKTRYNIRLAQKKGVMIKQGKEYVKDFLKLTKLMAKRQGIVPHSDEYYQKMLKVIPSDILKLYVAEYKNKIIAADFVVFYDKTATYLHGSSSYEHRSVMAPYFLKWQEILDAKKLGCVKFDFGGVKTRNKEGNDWTGITRFKLGFSKSAQTTKFLGSYDIVINSKKYFLYRFIQKLKKFF